MPNEPSEREVIGLVPAAGQATRIQPLPCSKELYPIGFRQMEDGSLRPKVACHYLLDSFRAAGIRNAYVILRTGKWDIPTYLGDGASIGIHISYLMMNLPWGAPYTLDQAFPFVQDKLIALGFPDCLFEPEDAFRQLLHKQRATGADVVLGLFPTTQFHRSDMVDLDDQGRVRQIVVRPPATDLRYGWIIAVWTPQFTRFMHDYLRTGRAATQSGSQRESYVGEIIQASIERNLSIQTVPFPEGRFTDIGTPEDLSAATRSFSEKPKTP